MNRVIPVRMRKVWREEHLLRSDSSRLAGESALRSSLASGLYPEYKAAEGPADSSSPDGKSTLDYLLLLWPTAICQLICLQTNSYALQHNCLNWAPVSTDELWTFLGIVVLMGIHRLPTINQPLLEPEPVSWCACYPTKNVTAEILETVVQLTSGGQPTSRLQWYQWSLSKGEGPFRHPQPHVLPALYPITGDISGRSYGEVQGSLERESIHATLNQ